MLGQCYDQSLMADVWEAVEARVQLPVALRSSFFDKSGPMPTHHENNRSYHRYFMRAKAVLKRGDAKLGIYTKDVSRQGIGLLSPVQLMPLDAVELILPDGSQLNLKIARCRRIDRECFECGARFAL